MKSLKLTVAALVASAAFAGVAAARDQIQVAGSSTVLPYAKIVAENFGETFPDFKTPVVESGALLCRPKEFCKGVGEDTIDIANSSRRSRTAKSRPARLPRDRDPEVKIGYDGIVFATRRRNADLALKPEHIYKALAAEVVVDRQARRQSYKNWSKSEHRCRTPKSAAYIPGESTCTREVSKRRSLPPAARTPGAQDVIRPPSADEKRSTANASRCARTAWPSISTATTPRRWLVSTPTRTASASSVSRLRKQCRQAEGRDVNGVRSFDRDDRFRRVSRFPPAVLPMSRRRISA